MIDTNLNYKSDHNYSGLIKIRNIVDDNCSYYEDNEGKKELKKFKINDHQKILSSGDILFLDSKYRKAKILFADKIIHNTLLLTEQCNSKCIFCSQPPNYRNDEWLWKIATDVLKIINTEKVIGITGGEVTLNENRFINFLEDISINQNKLNLHILSNGRTFKDSLFVNEIKKFKDKLNILWGIPLYSHNSSVHDQIVEVDGAWEETVNGLINLLQIDSFIELRHIPIQSNITLINEFTEFVCRFLPTINQVSIMSLEKKGWAKLNWNKINLDYNDQHTQLIIESAKRFELSNINLNLFNYPLCKIDKTLWKYANKSISDWKNIYRKSCDKCAMKEECCGLFLWDDFTKVEPIKYYE